MVIMLRLSLDVKDWDRSTVKGQEFSIAKVFKYTFYVAVPARCKPHQTESKEPAAGKGTGADVGTK